MLKYGRVFALIFAAIYLTIPSPSLASEDGSFKRPTHEEIQKEVSDINKAIKAKRARWVAGETSITKLSGAERGMRLGIVDKPLPREQRKAVPKLGTTATGGGAVTASQPGTLDWRSYNGQNFVTGVRDQGNCGDCWAFGSTAGLESKTLITRNTPGVDLNLSEQVVASCDSGDWGYSTGACEGGYLVTNFFVNTGIPLETCYPYAASDNSACSGACANWQQNAYKTTSCTWVVPYGSQQTAAALKSGLYAYGPIVVTFAVYRDFYSYKSGIYTHTSGNFQGYHAVLLTGYDDTNNCFIVKNSWGSGWGEGGYFRIAYSEVSDVCEFGYEALAYGDPVSRDPSSKSDLPHYNWNPAMTQDGTDCGFCHIAPNTFLAADFKNKPEFCYSCHNAAGNGHALSIYSSHGQHVMFANATAAGRRKPSYGNITAGEANNMPYKKLLNGYQITCYTCHNGMKKSDDPGRTWEYTTTSDRYKYYLQNGGWSGYGLVPKIYRSSSVWTNPPYSPTYTKDKKSYLVSPSEYAYNEMSGFVRFKTQQSATDNIYVSLYYPYLRAPMQGNALCADCHAETTHKNANCLNCHQAHNTGNLKGIKEKVRTLDYSSIPVRFLRYTGVNSFADGDNDYSGICEVCHTKTKYYKRDGTGFSNHSGGVNYDRKDCTSCHSHASGFGR